MHHNLLIKFLEGLEETYPNYYHAEKLIKRLGLHSFDGEFFKITKYLRHKGKITVGYNIPDNSNREILRQGDEVSITPDGIDFLVKLQSIEVEKKRNKIIMWATIGISLATITNVIIAFVK